MNTNNTTYKNQLAFKKSMLQQSDNEKKPKTEKSRKQMQYDPLSFYIQNPPPKDKK